MSTFKAVVATQVDGKTHFSIQQLDRSALPPGEVLIRVRYSGLNYKDGAVLQGWPGFIRKFPMVCGIDLSGVVEESASPEFKVGDEIVVTGWGLSETQWGGYSELARLDAKYLMHLPKAINLKRAMAIGTAGFTAMQCVLALEKQGVQKGDRPVLVTGAGGGVGSVAIAILGSLGYKVTASTGRAELGPYLRSLGATEIVDRAEISAPSKGPLLSERWAGVVDSVGGETIAGALRAVAVGGTVAACGLAGGANFTANVVPFILRSVKLVGINSVSAPQAERKEVWGRLASDLPMNLLDEMTQEQPMANVFQLAEQIIAGKIRGRMVISVG